MISKQPERNLALDLVRITESAALSSSRWLGRGNKIKGDAAAVDAMRVSFTALDIEGTVVIGEGEKDNAPMLFNGEVLGTGKGPKMDVAVDPVEGTRLLAYGRPNAISVVALAPKGAMFDPGPAYYMKKLVGPKATRGKLDINAPVSETLTMTASCLGKQVQDLVVFVLDKPRHEKLIYEIREAGARVQLHTDGDVAGALMALSEESDVDLMLGTGGSPEGVLAATVVRAMDGEMQAMLDPQSNMEKARLLEAGYDLDQVYDAKDLVLSEDIFFAATGISGGTFLNGVTYEGDGARTHSMVLRGRTGTMRYIESHHTFAKLMRISAIKYD